MTQVDEVNELGELFWPMLTRHDVTVQGALISRLLAHFLVSLKVKDDPAKTAEVRIGLLDTIVTNARAQVAYIEAEKNGQGRASG